MFHGKVGTIKNDAFRGTAITELHISEVNKIGPSAFQWCEKLKEVHIGKVDSIGAEAFYGCIALEVLDIPKKVTNIGDRAFYGCKKLKKDGFIIVNGSLFESGNNPKISEGVVKISKQACKRCGELFSLPSTIRAINEQKCYGILFQQLPAGTLQTEEKLSGTTLLQHIDEYWQLEKKDWAAMYVFQTDKKLEEICRKHMEGNYGECIAEMLYFLEEKGNARRYKKVAELIIGHPEEVDCDIIQKFYDIASAKKMKTAEELVKPYYGIYKSSIRK